MRLFSSRLRCPRCGAPVTIQRDFSEPKYVAVLLGGYFGVAVAGFIALVWSSLWLALLIAIIGGALLTIYDLRAAEYVCPQCKASYVFSEIRAAQSNI